MANISILCAFSASWNRIMTLWTSISFIKVKTFLASITFYTKIRIIDMSLCSYFSTTEAMYINFSTLNTIHLNRKLIFLTIAFPICCIECKPMAIWALVTYLPILGTFETSINGLTTNGTSAVSIDKISLWTLGTRGTILGTFLTHWNLTTAFFAFFIRGDEETFAAFFARYCWCYRCPFTWKTICIQWWT